MPPRPYDPVSMSNHQPIMDSQYHHQHQHQQSKQPPPYGTASPVATASNNNNQQGYAYYAAPQYNFNYGANNVNPMNPQFISPPPPPPLHTWQPQQQQQQQPYQQHHHLYNGAPITLTDPTMMDPTNHTNNLSSSSCNYVMERILEPHDNDVLMGRGGKNNQHAGMYLLYDVT